ncbi:MAG: cellulase family glycosylhydrolase [Oscillospiraceae bacterium]|jgi:aryl-phospho-beta-D-glucosidase BglC (GH1 family)|nr:cellulase family glycosylhydrolase [Oscillospiraceae bacterium]
MPRYGFNMLWMFSKRGDRAPLPPDLRQLDFIAKHGFNFIRVPLDYRFWTQGEDYTNPDEGVLSLIDSYLEACRERGLHMSLNIHRAPGYCINNPPEKYCLWTDVIAQDAFTFLWEHFARRYKGVPSESLSFDLLNEPPNPGQRSFTRERHEAVMRRVIVAVRAPDPEREIVLDGVSGGSEAIPELADVGAIHSGRGYSPFTVSHHRAEWVSEPKGGWPEPAYPGGGWDRDKLREHYRPWRETEQKGVRIHIGEFGCYNKTPNTVALAWLTDLLGLWREYRWGYALWNFSGPFGVANHNRPGVAYETMDGFAIDRALWELLLGNRV